MASPEYVRTVCPECGWRKAADFQTDETPKEFWCFRCGKRVLPRVISLRMTPAQRRLKGAFYMAIAVFIIAVLALAYGDAAPKENSRHTNAPGATHVAGQSGGWGGTSDVMPGV